LDSDVNGFEAKGIGLVDGGAVLNQQRDGNQIACHTGPMQAGSFFGIQRLDIGLVIEKKADKIWFVDPAS
jgi:hypothetical protein